MARPKKEPEQIEPVQIKPVNGNVVVIIEKSEFCKAGTEKTISVQHAETLIKKGVARYK